MPNSNKSPRVSAASGERFEFVSADGLQLTGVTWGTGDLPVVFSPGNGFNAQSYGPSLRPLADSCRIFGINPRGHGGSEVPKALDTWDPLLKDLERFVEEKHPPAVVLAGHSGGALLSLWLASLRPELVAGLLLLDPVLPFGPESSETERTTTRGRETVERARNRRAHWESRGEARETLHGRGGYAGWHPEPFELFLESGMVDDPAGGVNLACPPWLEVAIYMGYPAKAIWDWPEKITAPAVILRGDASPVAAQGPVETLADRLPVATVITVKGGHTFCQEHPASTGKAMAAAMKILAPKGKTN